MQTWAKAIVTYARASLTTDHSCSILAIVLIFDHLTTNCSPSTFGFKMTFLPAEKGISRWTALEAGAGQEATFGPHGMGDPKSGGGGGGKWLHDACHIEERAAKEIFSFCMLCVFF